MEWEKSRESDNVVEESGPQVEFGNGGGRRPAAGIPLSLGGIAIIVVAGLLFGVNPIEILSVLDGSSSGFSATSSQPTSPISSSDPQVRFVRSILGSTEDVWGGYFQRMGQQYEEPKINLFQGRVHSGCGLASEAMGPFYCPADHRVYLDLNFFQEMESRFHASGDFARAYVIAHEVGHHVQELLGYMAKVDQARRAGRAMEGAEGLSVRLELQADCFAGVWANRSEQQLNWLQDGDIESALNAAKQIGDDLLQSQTQGFVVPDSFTHGTSAQRAHWFRIGFSSGDVRQCNTFAGQI